MDVFSYSDFSFAENLFNLNREEIIEKYSTMGLIDPINLRSFLSVVAKEIDKAKPAEEQRKFKVINLISDIVDNIEPFELALSLSFRKDSRNITSPDVRFFQRVLAGNIPIKSFLPVQNEILSGGSSERIKNLVYRWADTIYFNSDFCFFESILTRVDLGFFNPNERLRFCSSFCQHLEYSADFLAQYSICGFVQEDACGSGTITPSLAFRIPEKNITYCRDLLYQLFRHCICSPEHIPGYVAERLYLEALTFDPMTHPSNNLFFVAANLGHTSAAREAGKILAVRDNYSTEPTEEEKTRLLWAVAYFYNSLDDVSLWNIAFILERNWLPDGKGIELIRMLEPKIKPDTMLKQLPEAKLSLYESLCSQITEEELKFTLLIHFTLAYIKNFPKSLNSISNIVAKYKLSYEEKQYERLCYDFRQEAVYEGDITAIKNISRMIEKEMRALEGTFQPVIHAEYKKMHDLEAKFYNLSAQKGKLNG